MASSSIVFHGGVAMPPDGFSDESYWSEAWARHLETYLAAEPRCGRWLRSRFGLHGWSVLECAGGSCRDARFLHDCGIDAVGSDFDHRTIEYLRHRDPASAFRVMRQDASNLEFEDRSFDLVFHNGFWVLFDDDVRIRSLLVEQIRVARRVAVALVHNALNEALVSKFAERAERDSLYRIRFFTPDDLRGLVAGVSDRIRRVSIEPFGGDADRLYRLARRAPILRGLMQPLAPRLYALQRWSRTERLALVMELE
jgi:hypothetical protein